MSGPQMFSNNPPIKTGINFACSLGSAADVENMLKSGCDPHEKNKYGEEAIIVAAEVNSAGCVEVLLEAGVDIKTESPTGKTVAYYADLHRNEDMLELVTKYSAKNTLR